MAISEIPLSSVDQVFSTAIKIERQKRNLQCFTKFEGIHSQNLVDVGNKNRKYVSNSGTQRGDRYVNQTRVLTADLIKEPRCLGEQTILHTKVWILDSGATDHLSSSLAFFSSYHSVKCICSTS